MKSAQSILRRNRENQMIFRIASTRKMWLTAALLLLSVILVMLSGCKTAPEFSVKDYPALVSDYGSLFVSFNLKKGRELVTSYLDKGGNAQDISKIIDRTDRISFSFSDQPTGGYSAVAEGSYPGLITFFALANSPEWVKHKSIYTWWENKSSHLQLSLPIHTVALFSTGNISHLMEKFKNGERGYIPEFVKREMEKSTVLLYTSLPSPALFRVFGLKMVQDDVVELDISLIKNDNGHNKTVSASYKIWGFIQLKNTAKARLFNTGLKLGLLTMARREGNSAIKKLIKENPFELQNTKIIFNGVDITMSEIREVMKDKK